MTRRVQAALAALALVLAGLLGTLHEAATTHVRCATHGELIHRDATVASAGATAPALVLDDLRAEAVAGHEHCSLTSVTRASRLLPRSPAVLPAPVLASSLATSVPRVAVARGGGLYRTAPKTSPPA